MSAPNVPSKTPLGHDELRTRRQKLSQRHRTVLLLVDGQRPLAEVLSLVQRAGASLSHFEDLVRMGLVELPVEAMAPEPAMTEPGALSTLRSTHLELEVPAPAVEPEAMPEATAERTTETTTETTGEATADGPPGPQPPAAVFEGDAADAPPLPARTAPRPEAGGAAGGAPKAALPGAPEAALLDAPGAALPGAPEAALPSAPEAALPRASEAALLDAPGAALPGAPEAALPDASDVARPDAAAALPDAPAVALPDAPAVARPDAPDVTLPDAVAAREPGVSPARRPPPRGANVATASQPRVAPVPAAPRPPPRSRPDHDALSLRTAVAELPDLAGLPPPRAPSATAGRAPAARRTPPAARMPDPVVPRRRVPEPQPTATHDDEEPGPVAERVRRSLMQVAQDNPVPFVSRLLARIEQASTLDELRDLVLEVERRLRRPASGGAARLQEARELLGLGNTVVTGDSRVDWPSED